MTASELELLEVRHPEINEIYALDTYAWVEYFSGSKMGKKVEEYLKTGRCITPTIVVAELSVCYDKIKENFEDRLNFIKMNSRIIGLGAEIAILVGKIQNERRETKKGWGIIDSIILATAKILNAKIITGDEHFRDIEYAIMIK